MSGGLFPVKDWTREELLHDLKQRTRRELQWWILQKPDKPWKKELQSAAIDMLINALNRLQDEKKS